MQPLHPSPLRGDRAARADSLVVLFLPITCETIRLTEVFQMGSFNEEWTTHWKTLWITGGLGVS